MKKLMLLIVGMLIAGVYGQPTYAQQANEETANMAANSADQQPAAMDQTQEGTDQAASDDQMNSGATDSPMDAPADTMQMNANTATNMATNTDAAPAATAPAAAENTQAAATAPVADAAANGPKAADQANPVAVPAGAAAAATGKAQAVNFGDFRSSTLTKKAWDALNANDIESVLAYTNKCIELYAEQARKMQSGLKDYPTGSNDDIFKYWALNDVATSYYIQGEAYRKANMKDESKEAFGKLIKDYSFGQAWDPKGWFWKPAEAAKEKMAMTDAGVNLDFGDYSSNVLVQKAWGALAAKDTNAVVAYVNKTLELYGNKAKEMQGSLKEYPWESKEKTMSYWALNDVGTALFILGEAYRTGGKKEEASQTYKKLIDEYFYAQCWDPQGWFWKPAEAAQQKLAELDNV